jgi:DNA-binding protein H-NS
VVIVPSLALSTRWQISSSVTPKQIGPLKGRKVPPKYRSPSGETWAGRGARPRWLVAALKRGKKADDFLIKRKPKR